MNNIYEHPFRGYNPQTNRNDGEWYSLYSATPDGKRYLDPSKAWAELEQMEKAK